MQCHQKQKEVLVAQSMGSHVKTKEWYTLNKKGEQKTQIGFSFCLLYKTISSLPINQMALVLKYLTLFWKNNNQKKQ